jgi:hypothetical protein
LAGLGAALLAGCQRAVKSIATAAPTGVTVTGAPNTPTRTSKPPATVTLTPTETPVPAQEFTFLANTLRVNDNRWRKWNNPEWFWITNDSGKMSVLDDPTYGKIIRYDVTHYSSSKRFHETPDMEMVRICPGKNGWPKITGTYELTIPVRFSRNFLPTGEPHKRGDGSDYPWVNFLTIFNEDPQHGDPDYNITAGINLDGDRLQIVSDKPYLGGNAFDYKTTGIRPEPETWHELTVRSYKNERKLELWYNGKLVASCKRTSEPQGESAIAEWHGGAYGQTVPLNSWIENGPVTVKVWDDS